MTSPVDIKAESSLEWVSITVPSPPSVDYQGIYETAPASNAGEYSLMESEIGEQSLGDGEAHRTLESRGWQCSEGVCVVYHFRYVETPELTYLEFHALLVSGAEQPGELSVPAPGGGGGFGNPGNHAEIRAALSRLDSARRDYDSAVSEFHGAERDLASANSDLASANRALESVKERLKSKEADFNRVAEVRNRTANDRNRAAQEADRWRTKAGNSEQEADRLQEEKREQEDIKRRKEDDLRSHRSLEGIERHKVETAIGRGSTLNAALEGKAARLEEDGKNATKAHNDSLVNINEKTRIGDAFDNLDDNVRDIFDSIPDGIEVDSHAETEIETEPNSPYFESVKTGKRAIRGIQDLIGASQSAFKDRGGFIARIGAASLDAADSAYAANDGALGDDTWEFARSCGAFALDLATSLTPGVSWGRDIYEAFSGKDLISGEELDSFSRAFAIIGAVTAGIGSKVGKATKGMTVVQSIADSSAEVVRGGSIFQEALSQARALLAAAPDMDLTAIAKRKQPGTVIVTGTHYDSGRLLRGSEGSAGHIPLEIANKIKNRRFTNFDKFREEFWRVVAASRYVDEFEAIETGNSILMREGRAPFVSWEQTTNAADVYELHHMKPINRGGSVYDLSNLLIVTPLFHDSILNREYHYGRRRLNRPLRGFRALN